jgi:hypothetical protein
LWKESECRKREIDEKERERERFHTEKHVSKNNPYFRVELNSKEYIIQPKLISDRVKVRKVCSSTN